MAESRPDGNPWSQLQFRSVRAGKVIQAKIAGHAQVVFCRHALDRMAQRGVTEKEVLATIRKPTKAGLPT